MTWRLAAAALLVAGLVSGSVAPPPPTPPPQFLDSGEAVLQADFHVHAFVGDGWIPPWELPREARRRGLDAIAVTNHNQVLAARVVRWFAERLPAPIVLTGEEVTAPGYHLIAAGIGRHVDWRLGARDAVSSIHAQGGVAIAAHPRERYWAAYDDALDVLDGAEAAHPLMIGDPEGGAELDAFYTRAGEVRIRPLSAIGSSDYHLLSAVGLCRTLVLARERSADAILEAVRNGRTVALDPFGGLHGAPELVALVQRAGGPRVPAPRTRMEALGAALSWAGLMGMLLAPWRR
jgi:predicted metal-dependent phosphoesterase TrpH